ncbi:MAG: non-canonical purine NTP diphosphatase [Flavobacteriaceae bacterium]|nr:non-canonical purine NTP diphosphatase [Flavobacteriaceae bacterium]
MEIVFATNNKHKLKEIQALMPEGIAILSLSDIGCTDEIEETEPTLEGNARLKADHVTKNYGYPCFSDDTGLEVEALNGAPGVYSARYAGEGATFENNMEKLLQQMEGQQNRFGRFRTVIALNIDDCQYLFEGICEGNILKQKQGTAGFGYDPVFQPKGYERTFAEMDMAEKGKISHRGQAIKKLIEFLKFLILNQKTSPYRSFNDVK